MQFYPLPPFLDSVFSFGMVVFELLALERPYMKEQFVNQKVVDQQPPRNAAKFPTAKKYDPLKRLWESCTRFNPSDRPTAQEIQQTLSSM